jgi:hypothetical protein
MGYVITNQPDKVISQELARVVEFGASRKITLKNPIKSY